ncbi:GlxA family transcriptional regulator [Ruegeria sp.]|uniref:GlxA family transcriptional regulator n=1 Tax=Ruegeria sp. TaxID=1879320 RepID=UPI003B59F306
MADGQTPSNRQLSIGFILADRFTLTAFSSFVDVLRLAADAGDSSRPIRCKWRILSPDLEPVHASCGLRIYPEDRFGDPKDFDYIVVVGGLVEHIESKNIEFNKFLQKAAAARVPLVGLCTGSFILHDAGLMDGYKCCVSWFHRADFLERFEGLEPVSDRIYVVDRDRLTCSGGSSAAHLAAFIVEKHIGRRYARKSLSILIVDEVYDGGKAQPNLPLQLSTQDNLLQRALVIMQQNLENGIKISDLASTLRMSRRTLEGRFKKELGLTPYEVMNLIRVEKAKDLLINTQDSVSEISLSTGFCDSSHMYKVFMQREGRPPSAFRKQAS